MSTSETTAQKDSSVDPTNNNAHQTTTNQRRRFTNASMQASSSSSIVRQTLKPASVLPTPILVGRFQDKLRDELDKTAKKQQEKKEDSSSSYNTACFPLCQPRVLSKHHHQSANNTSSAVSFPSSSSLSASGLPLPLPRTSSSSPSPSNSAASYYSFTSYIITVVFDLGRTVFQASGSAQDSFRNALRLICAAVRTQDHLKNNNGTTTTKDSPKHSSSSSSESPFMIEVIVSNIPDQLQSSSSGPSLGTYAQLLEDFPIGRSVALWPPTPLDFFESNCLELATDNLGAVERSARQLLMLASASGVAVEYPEFDPLRAVATALAVSPTSRCRERGSNVVIVADFSVRARYDSSDLASLEMFYAQKGIEITLLDIGIDNSKEQERCANVFAGVRLRPGYLFSLLSAVQGRADVFNLPRMLENLNSDDHMNLLPPSPSSSNHSSNNNKNNMNNNVSASSHPRHRQQQYPSSPEFERELRRLGFCLTTRRVTQITLSSKSNLSTPKSLPLKKGSVTYTFDPKRCRMEYPVLYFLHIYALRGWGAQIESHQHQRKEGEVPSSSTSTASTLLPRRIRLSKSTRQREGTVGFLINVEVTYDEKTGLASLFKEFTISAEPRLLQWLRTVAEHHANGTMHMILHTPGSRNVFVLRSAIEDIDDMLVRFLIKPEEAEVPTSSKSLASKQQTVSPLQTLSSHNGLVLPLTAACKVKTMTFVVSCDSFYKSQCPDCKGQSSSTDDHEHHHPAVFSLVNAFSQVDDLLSKCGSNCVWNPISSDYVASLNTGTAAATTTTQPGTSAAAPMSSKEGTSSSTGTKDEETTTTTTTTTKDHHPSHSQTQHHQHQQHHASTTTNLNPHYEYKSYFCRPQLFTSEEDKKTMQACDHATIFLQVFQRKDFSQQHNFYQSQLNDYHKKNQQNSKTVSMMKQTRENSASSMQQQEGSSAAEKDHKEDPTATNDQMNTIASPLGTQTNSDLLRSGSDSINPVSEKGNNNNNNNNTSNENTKNAIPSPQQLIKSSERYPSHSSSYPIHFRLILPGIFDDQVMQYVHDKVTSAITNNFPKLPGVTIDLINDQRTELIVHKIVGHPRSLHAHDHQLATKHIRASLVSELPFLVNPITQATTSAYTFVFPYSSSEGVPPITRLVVPRLVANLDAKVILSHLVPSTGAFVSLHKRTDRNTGKKELWFLQRIPNKCLKITLVVMNVVDQSCEPLSGTRWKTWNEQQLRLQTHSNTATAPVNSGDVFKKSQFPSSPPIQPVEMAMSTNNNNTNNNTLMNSDSSLIPPSPMTTSPVSIAVTASKPTTQYHLPNLSHHNARGSVTTSITPPSRTPLTSPKGEMIFRVSGECNPSTEHIEWTAKHLSLAKTMKELNSIACETWPQDVKHPNNRDLPSFAQPKLQGHVDLEPVFSIPCLINHLQLAQPSSKKVLSSSSSTNNNANNSNNALPSIVHVETIKIHSDLFEILPENARKNTIRQAYFATRATMIHGAAAHWNLNISSLPASLTSLEAFKEVAISQSCSSVTVLCFRKEELCWMSSESSSSSTGGDQQASAVSSPHENKPNTTNNNNENQQQQQTSTNTNKTTNERDFVLGFVPHFPNDEVMISTLYKKQAFRMMLLTVSPEYIYNTLVREQCNGIKVRGWSDWQVPEKTQKLLSMMTSEEKRIATSRSALRLWSTASSLIHSCFAISIYSLASNNTPQSAADENNTQSNINKKVINSSALTTPTAANINASQNQQQHHQHALPHLPPSQSQTSICSLHSSGVLPHSQQQQPSSLASTQNNNNNNNNTAASSVAVSPSHGGGTSLISMLPSPSSASATGNNFKDLPSLFGSATGKSSTTTKTNAAPPQQQQQQTPYVFSPQTILPRAKAILAKSIGYWEKTEEILDLTFVQSCIDCLIKTATSEAEEYIVLEKFASTLVKVIEGIQVAASANSNVRVLQRFPDGALVCSGEEHDDDDDGNDHDDDEETDCDDDYDDEESDDDDDEARSSENTRTENTTTASQPGSPLVTLSSSSSGPQQQQMNKHAADEDGFGRVENHQSSSSNATASNETSSVMNNDNRNATMIPSWTSGTASSMGPHATSEERRRQRRKQRKQQQQQQQQSEKNNNKSSTRRQHRHQRPERYSHGILLKHFPVSSTTAGLRPPPSLIDLDFDLRQTLIDNILQQQALKRAQQQHNENYTKKSQNKKSPDVGGDISASGDTTGLDDPDSKIENINKMMMKPSASEIEQAVDALADSIGDAKPIEERCYSSNLSGISSSANAEQIQFHQPSQQHHQPSLSTNDSIHRTPSDVALQNSGSLLNNTNYQQKQQQPSQNNTKNTAASPSTPTLSRRESFSLSRMVLNNNTTNNQNVTTATNTPQHSTASPKSTAQSPLASPNTTIGSRTFSGHQQHQQNNDDNDNNLLNQSISTDAGRSTQQQQQQQQLQQQKQSAYNALSELAHLLMRSSGLSSVNRKSNSSNKSIISSSFSLKLSFASVPSSHVEIACNERGDLQVNEAAIKKFLQQQQNLYLQQQQHIAHHIKHGTLNLSPTTRQQQDPQNTASTNTLSSNVLLSSLKPGSSSKNVILLSPSPLYLHQPLSTTQIASPTSPNPSPHAKTLSSLIVSQLKNVLAKACMEECVKRCVIPTQQLHKLMSVSALNKNNSNTTQQGQQQQQNQKSITSNNSSSSGATFNDPTRPPPLPAIASTEFLLNPEITISTTSTSTTNDTTQQQQQQQQQQQRDPQHHLNSGPANCLMMLEASTTSSAATPRHLATTTSAATNRHNHNHTPEIQSATTQQQKPPHHHITSADSTPRSHALKIQQHQSSIKSSQDLGPFQLAIPISSSPITTHSPSVSQVSTHVAAVNAASGVAGPFSQQNQQQQQQETSATTENHQELTSTNTENDSAATTNAQQQQQEQLEGPYWKHTSDFIIPNAVISCIQASSKKIAPNQTHTFVVPVSLSTSQSLEEYEEMLAAQQRLHNKQQKNAAAAMAAARILSRHNSNYDSRFQQQQQQQFNYTSNNSLLNQTTNSVSSSIQRGNNNNNKSSKNTTTTKQQQQQQNLDSNKNTKFVEENVLPWVMGALDSSVPTTKQNSNNNQQNNDATLNNAAKNPFLVSSSAVGSPRRHNSMSVNKQQQHNSTASGRYSFQRTTNQQQQQQHQNRQGSTANNNNKDHQPTESTAVQRRNSTAGGVLATTSYGSWNDLNQQQNTSTNTTQQQNTQHQHRSSPPPAAPLLSSASSTRHHHNRHRREDSLGNISNTSSTSAQSNAGRRSVILSDDHEYNTGGGHGSAANSECTSQNLNDFDDEFAVQQQHPEMLDPPTYILTIKESSSSSSTTANTFSASILSSNSMWVRPSNSPVAVFVTWEVSASPPSSVANTCPSIVPGCGSLTLNCFAFGPEHHLEKVVGTAGVYAMMMQLQQQQQQHQKTVSSSTPGGGGGESVISTHLAAPPSASLPPIPGSSVTTSGQTSTFNTLPNTPSAAAQNVSSSSKQQHQTVSGSGGSGAGLPRIHSASSINNNNNMMMTPQHHSQQQHQNTNNNNNPSATASSSSANRTPNTNMNTNTNIIASNNINPSQAQIQQQVQSYCKSLLVETVDAVMKAIRERIFSFIQRSLVQRLRDHRELDKMLLPMSYLLEQERLEKEEKEKEEKAKAVDNNTAKSATDGPSTASATTSNQNQNATTNKAAATTSSSSSATVSSDLITTSYACPVRTEEVKEIFLDEGALKVVEVEIAEVLQLRRIPKQSSWYLMPNMAIPENHHDPLHSVVYFTSTSRKVDFAVPSVQTPSSTPRKQQQFSSSASSPAVSSLATTMTTTKQGSGKNLLMNSKNGINNDTNNKEQDTNFALTKGTRRTDQDENLPQFAIVLQYFSLPGAEFVQHTEDLVNEIKTAAQNAVVAYMYEKKSLSLRQLNEVFFAHESAWDRRNVKMSLNEAKILRDLLERNAAFSELKFVIVDELPSNFKDDGGGVIFCKTRDKIAFTVCVDVRVDLQTLRSQKMEQQQLLLLSSQNGNNNNNNNNASISSIPSSAAPSPLKNDQLHQHNNNQTASSSITNPPPQPTAAAAASIMTSNHASHQQLDMSIASSVPSHPNTPSPSHRPLPPPPPSASSSRQGSEQPQPQQQQQQQQQQAEAVDHQQLQTPLPALASADGDTTNTSTIIDQPQQSQSQSKSQSQQQQSNIITDEMLLPQDKNLAVPFFCNCTFYHSEDYTSARDLAKQQKAQQQQHQEFMNSANALAIGGLNTLGGASHIDESTSIWFIQIVKERVIAKSLAELRLIQALTQAMNSQRPTVAASTTTATAASLAPPTKKYPLCTSSSPSSSSPFQILFDDENWLNARTPSLSKLDSTIRHSVYNQDRFGPMTITKILDRIGTTWRKHLDHAIYHKGYILGSVAATTTTQQKSGSTNNNDQQQESELQQKQKIANWAAQNENTMIRRFGNCMFCAFTNKAHGSACVYVKVSSTDGSIQVFLLRQFQVFGDEVLLDDLEKTVSNTLQVFREEGRSKQTETLKLLGVPSSINVANRLQLYQNLQQQQQQPRPFLAKITQKPIMDPQLIDLVRSTSSLVNVVTSSLHELQNEEVTSWKRTWNRSINNPSSSFVVAPCLDTDVISISFSHSPAIEQEIFERITESLVYRKFALVKRPSKDQFRSSSNDNNQRRSAFDSYNNNNNSNGHLQSNFDPSYSRRDGIEAICVRIEGSSKQRYTNNNQQQTSSSSQASTSHPNSRPTSTLQNAHHLPSSHSMSSFSTLQNFSNINQSQPQQQSTSSTPQQQHQQQSDQQQQGSTTSTTTPIAILVVRLSTKRLSLYETQLAVEMHSLQLGSEAISNTTRSEQFEFLRTNLMSMMLNYRLKAVENIAKSINFRNDMHHDEQHQNTTSPQNTTTTTKQHKSSSSPLTDSSTTTAEKSPLSPNDATTKNDDSSSSVVDVQLSLLRQNLERCFDGGTLPVRGSVKSSLVASTNGAGLFRVVLDEALAKKLISSSTLKKQQQKEQQQQNNKATNSHQNKREKEKKRIEVLGIVSDTSFLYGVELGKSFPNILLFLLLEHQPVWGGAQNFAAAATTTHSLMSNSHNSSRNTSGSLSHHHLHLSASSTGNNNNNNSNILPGINNTNNTNNTSKTPIVTLFGVNTARGTSFRSPDAREVLLALLPFRYWRKTGRVEQLSPLELMEIHQKFVCPRNLVGGIRQICNRIFADLVSKEAFQSLLKMMTDLAKRTTRTNSASSSALQSQLQLHHQHHASSSASGGSGVRCAPHHINPSLVSAGVFHDTEAQFNARMFGRKFFVLHQTVTASYDPSRNYFSITSELVEDLEGVRLDFFFDSIPQQLKDLVVGQQNKQQQQQQQRSNSSIKNFEIDVCSVIAVPPSPLPSHFGCLTFIKLSNITSDSEEEEKQQQQNNNTNQINQYRWQLLESNTCICRNRATGDLDAQTFLEYSTASKENSPQTDTVISQNKGNLFMAATGGGGGLFPANAGQNSRHQTPNARNPESIGNNNKNSNTNTRRDATPNSSGNNTNTNRSSSVKRVSHPIRNSSHQIVGTIEVPLDEEETSEALMRFMFAVSVAQSLKGLVTY